MLSTVTTTFNVHDLFGNDFDPRRAKAWATTNVDSIHDTSTGETRIGGGKATIAADGTGTFTHWAPGADGNPISWQTTYHFDVPDRTTSKGRRTESYGPFTVTTSGLLTALVEEQEVPPTYLSTVTALLDGYVDDAAASATAADSSADAAAASAALADSYIVADLNTSDGQMEALIESPTSLTAVALSNTSVSRTARLKHAPAIGLYFPEAEGAVGDGTTDDTVALQAALTAATGATLHLARGVTFVTDTVSVAANTRITGGGTLKFKTNTAAFALVAATNVSNVLIEGITFDGNVANQAVWSEFRHTLQIIGSSSHVTVRGCTFLNPIADGVYVVSSAGNIPSDVDIDGNSFIGTNVNRNGVTMTACTDSRVRGNYFYKMSKDTMPGAIDLEPNAVGDTISNIVVAGNTFVGGGTPTLQKAVAINNNVGASCTGIVVANNVIRDKFKYAIAAFGDAVSKAKTQVTITGNVIRGSFTASGSAAIIASSSVEVVITGNDLDCTTDYGFKSVGSTFLVEGNRFKNHTTYGLETTSTTLESGIINNNVFEDCGTNANASFGGMHIKGSYLTISGNRIISSGATKTQLGIYIEAGVKNFVDGNAGVGTMVRMLNFTTAPQHVGRNSGIAAFNSINGTYPPATETWVAGDTIYNSNAAAGGAVGWYCVATGTPGTWRTFGPIELSASATLDFPSVAAAGQQELTITVTGAATGDTVYLAPPSSLEAGLIATGRVSATNTVTIRVSNITAGAIDPASASWKVRVVK